MTLLSKRILIATGILISTISHAAPSGPGPKIDLVATAETCRQLAIKIDWLGRYQDRATCSSNLNGINTYWASQLILENDLKNAQPLISDAITHTKFAIDINCLGQDDMKSVVSSLQNILETIS